MCNIAHNSLYKSDASSNQRVVEWASVRNTVFWSAMVVIRCLWVKVIPAIQDMSRS